MAEETNTSSGLSAPQNPRARKKPAKKFPVFTVVAVAVVLVGGYFFWRSQQKPTTGKLVLGSVQRGDLIETVTASGSVNAQTGAEVHIGSQITGVIKKLNADIGTVVKAGQVIAELDLPDLKAQLAQAQAALGQAQLKYAQEVSGVNLTNTTAISAIVQARQSGLSATAQLKAAQANLQQQLVTTPSDIRKAETQLSAAIAGDSSAKSNLLAVQSTSNLSITNAQEGLSQAQANAAVSLVNEKREKDLLAKGFVAQADYDAAHALSLVNASEVRAAEKNLTLTQAKVAQDIATAQDQVTQADQAVIAARASLDAAKAESNLVDARTADVRSAIATIKEAQASIQLAEAGRANMTIKQQNVKVAWDAVTQAQQVVAYQQAQLNKSYIRSPITGTVLQLSAQQGETLAAGLSAPTLILVADLKRLQVDAYVDETDIAKVKLGQDVAISVDAFPSQTFHGKVQKIASGSTIQQGVVTYDVTVAITDKSLALKPDMTANVTIQTGKLTNVMYIPAMAVQATTTGSTVNVLKMVDGNQKVVPVKIKTGGTDGVNVEILSGLTESDKIVLAGNTTSTNRGPASPFGPTQRAGGGGGGGGGGGR